MRIEFEAGLGSVHKLLTLLSCCLSIPAAQAAIDIKDMPEVGTAPLTGRINLNVRNIKQEEKLPVRLSPILIDANKVEPLSLDAVMNLAMHRNLSYLQTQWLGRSAWLSFVGSAGAMNPFNWSPNAQNLGLYQSANFTAPAGVFGPGTPNVNTVFGTNFPIFRERYYTYGVTLSTGGTTLFNMVGNYYKAKVASASVKTSMQDTLFEACSNYFSLCRELSLLHVNDIVVENSKQIRDLNQGLFDCGMGTKLQLLQALTQLAQDRQQLVLQQAQARVAAIKLAVTLNMPLSDYILPQARPLEKTTLVDPHLPVETLVYLAVNHRPEIIKAREQVKYDFTQAALAITPLVPTASYVVTKGTFFPANGQNETTGNQRVLQVSWQLNNLGVPVIPNVAAGLATARSDQYALKNIILQVRSEVRQSYDNCLAYETNIKIAKVAAAEAQEQLKLAEERLKAGIGINIDVIQAQSALTNALRNYVDAIYSYNIEQAKLRRAIGGFTFKAVKHKLRYD